MTARDHRMVGMGYRVPKVWATLTEGQRGAASLAAYRRGPRNGFLAGLGAFVCAGCWICEARRLFGRWCWQWGRLFVPKVNKLGLFQL